MELGMRNAETRGTEDGELNVEVGMRKPEGRITEGGRQMTENRAKTSNDKEKYNVRKTEILYL